MSWAPCLIWSLLAILAGGLVLCVIAARLEVKRIERDFREYPWLVGRDARDVRHDA